MRVLTRPVPMFVTGLLLIVLSSFAEQAWGCQNGCNDECKTSSAWCSTATQTIGGIAYPSYISYTTAVCFDSFSGFCNKDITATGSCNGTEPVAWRLSTGMTADCPNDVTANTASTCSLWGTIHSNGNGTFGTSCAPS
jgi:hypothetical protein